jgi:uncharacterized protein YcbK (DUF882 family)
MLENMQRALFSWLLLGGIAAASPHARTTHPHMPSRPTSNERYPAISLFGAHVGEALVYRPFDGKGHVRRDAARSLEHLLRNRQTGARHRLHPRLGEALYQIGRHYPGHRIEIFSGYRPRAYCDRAHSRHMTGSAIDFHVVGVRNEDLIAYLRKTFHPAGVGFYPHGVHVHLDMERAKDTYWVDAGPLATDPTIDLAPHDTAPASEAIEAEEIDLPMIPQDLPPPPDSDPAIADDAQDAD